MLIQSTTDISNTITSAKTLITKQRERFLANLLENQATLNEDIKNLENQINALKKYKTIDQLDDAAKLANTCQKIFIITNFRNYIVNDDMLVLLCYSSGK